jgi:protein TonB
MPLIKYFAAAEDTLRDALLLAAPTAPVRISIGENVQTANLVRRTQPQAPPAARNAGIAGQVQFAVIIGKDGTIQNLQLISGHPLLIDAAMRAIRTWVYKPTLLNGAPAEVSTTITVTFPANQP